MTSARWPGGFYAARLAAAILGLHLAAVPGAARSVHSSSTLGRLADDALHRTRSSERLTVSDSVFFGGFDETSGTALPGGIWDFELDPGNTDPREGWRSEDLTERPLFVRRVTAADFAGDPVSALMTDGGSTGSVWFGAHEDEAVAGCWPGGMGYSNQWVQRAAKSFPYSGSGDVLIALDYFTDSEAHFDFTYVYVVDDLGVRSPVLNASVNGRMDDGKGYAGSLQEGSNLGTPDAPRHDVLTVDASVLPAGAADFEVIVEFDSDPLYSDGLDSFAGILNSVYGPAGFDDVHVTGEALDDLSDFESGADGWILSTPPPVGSFFAVAERSELEPVDPGLACACPLTEHVVHAAVTDGSDHPHPGGQHERLVSPPIYVGDPALDVFTSTVVQFDAWLDLPTSNGVGFSVAVDYYPWTCPVTSTVGWTIEPPANPVGQFFYDTPRCATERREIYTLSPGGVDSLRIVFELLQSCPDFGVPVCTGPEETNPSPYWDNVRLALTGNALAPEPIVELLYQDAFPNRTSGGAGSLMPDATIDVHSYLDLNAGDGDPTNAELGDSAVVHVFPPEQTAVHVNFRVYPGPELDTAHPWFSSYGGDFVAEVISGAQENWAKARMDTAEAIGGADPSAFATYDWPDGSETGAKIIPDGVLTPGTTVQYFFTAAYTSSPTEEAFAPDTSGGTYFELEVLPGYYTTAGPDGVPGILAPCLLYVDAYNAGAQPIIEDVALSNLVGQVVDASGRLHDNWDRYDYLGAETSRAAPLGRQANGTNGISSYQSLFYNTMLYNTGTHAEEGLRDEDAAVLEAFLRMDLIGHQGAAKGLWLSGDGIASIMSRPDRPNAGALLADIAGAALVCSAYHDPACGNDPTACVRLDGAAGAHFPQAAPYAARGNGCPTSHAFDVLATSGNGTGNLVYVDQDAGETETPFASVSNDQFAPGNPENWGVVIDGFSLHHLRATPAGWTGTDCGDDSVAVLTRAADVLSFLGADLGPGCEPPLIDLSTDPLPGPAPAITRLLPNAPNPFNPRTTIRYELAVRARVTLEIYDVTGRRVRTLAGETQEAGRYRLAWDGTTRAGTRAASGVYWVRLRTSGGFDGKTKVVLLK